MFLKDNFHCGIVPYSRCADQLLPNNTSESTTMWCANPAACSEWVYDNSDSFVAEFQLACQEWKRTLIGGVQAFGHMLGSFIIGSLSDRFGRKTLVVITGVTGAVLGLAKSFSTSYWLYVALEFLEAGFGDVMLPILTLAVEMVATKSRVTYTTLCNVGFSGGILVVLIAWLVPYWRNFQRVLYAPGLLFIVFIYIIDESPRWLLSKGKKEEAVHIIRKAANQNKLYIEENLLNMISCEKNEGLSFFTVLGNTFKSKSLLKRFIVCSVCLIACCFVSHGLIINSVSLSGSKYTNVALSFGLKLPSSILSGYIMAKFNRKNPLILFFMACATLCIGQPFIPDNLQWLLILIYMAGKMTATMCLTITQIYTCELFPTQTRSSMHALCVAIGKIGSITATQTPLMMAYWSGLPTAMFGAVALVAGLATLLLPDTGNQNLPDTVCEAEALEYSDTIKN
ncbi:solute carrier family 22 member 1-like [Cydia pomonella]|uniref:solute carrier family 22 member 1-like n=1 Tax=Cydia pomonella TaxID=82600 RepID=UPI002ADD50CF|nr:solute carrier family 22 member 1-like [Cydia pomonella]